MKEYLMSLKPCVYYEVRQPLILRSVKVFKRLLAAKNWNIISLVTSPLMSSFSIFYKIEKRPQSLTKHNLTSSWPLLDLIVHRKGGHKRRCHQTDEVRIVKQIRRL